MSWASLPIGVRVAAERELTRKQLDVLKLWANGYSDDFIADAMGRSRTTIREHRKAALRKLKPYMEEAAA